MRAPWIGACIRYDHRLSPRRTMKRRRLYTIGHSNRTVEELVAALHAWGVTTLVDIRHFTRSRANPQFNAASLRRLLPANGIAYVVMTELGGRRRATGSERNAGWRNASFKSYADYAESAAFQDALAELFSLAARETCAIMCAEAVWWRCHRRIVADYAITRRVPVMHIFTATKVVRATRTPFASYDRRTRTLRYARVDGTSLR
jgi:uncharacterized protein (DUF488 family)